MDQRKLVDATRELIDDETRHPVINTRWGWYCLAMAVQVARRHPLFTPDRSEVAGVAESIARQLFASVVNDPGLMELVSAGWNRHCDVQRGRDPAQPPQGLLDAELAPRPSRRDVEHIEELLGNPAAETHFSAQLIRLIKKADGENRDRLRRVYPHHVEALENWELTAGASRRDKVTAGQGDKETRE